MNSEWDKPTKHIVAVALTIFGLYILYISRPVLTILIIASLISFLLLPIIDFLQHRLRLPRGVAVLLSILLLILVVLLSPLIFVPPIINGFRVLAEIDYQILIDNIVGWTETTLIGLKQADTQLLGLTLNLDPFVDPALGLVQDTQTDITPTLPSVETIVNYFRSAATITYGFATNLAGTVVAGFVSFIITLLAIIYISLDAHKFGPRLLRLVPRAHRPEIAKLLSRLRRTWRAYFRGQLNLMIIIGIVTWLGNTAIGLPGAFALAVIAGVMELIPNLGPFLAAIPAVVVALIQGSTYLNVGHITFALIVIGLYLAIQQVENTFVVPRILGEAVDLHPLVVIMGVVVGASVAGILGALLAAPVIASIREIVSYLYAKILGEDPYPPQPETAVDEEPLSWLEQGKFLLNKGQQLISRLGVASPPLEGGQRESPTETEPPRAEVSQEPGD